MRLRLCLQYWYEGDEAGDLPVDFSIVWDGDFFIDKPAAMKGINTHQYSSKLINTHQYSSITCLLSVNTNHVFENVV